MRRLPLLFALLVGLGSAAALFALATSNPEPRPELSHTVKRGDLVVTVVEQGMLESAENDEIKCGVRGRNTVLWVIESGSIVEPGDELVRLDTSRIQEQIDERTKFANWSQSAADSSSARLATAKLAVKEYEQGRFVAQLMTKEKDLAIAKSRLVAARNLLDYTERMSNSGYKSELEVEEREFAVEQADLAVKLSETQIDVLKKFTQAEQLQTLKGNLASTKATHEANVERALADGSRRDRALAEIKQCVVKAKRGGLVIHPNAARWNNAPEIEEGASVYKDQVMLLMPDLTKMQVKVGVLESIVDRVKKGQVARVTLPESELTGEVSSVASVTRPAGWWTGNEVKYDTLIDLPAGHGLRPGMSAEVEITIATYEDVLTVPVVAIEEDGDSHYCWVKSDTGKVRTKVTIGDTNDVYTIVEEGLNEGDEVVLNPPITIKDTTTSTVDTKK